MGPLNRGGLFKMPKPAGAMSYLCSPWQRLGLEVPELTPLGYGLSLQFEKVKILSLKLTKKSAADLFFSPKTTS